MKIAFLLPDLSGGGAENRTLCLAQTLELLGHQVYLFLLQERLDYPLPQGLRHEVLQIPSVPRFLRYRAYARTLKNRLKAIEKTGSLDLIVGILFDAHRVLYHLAHPRAVYSIRNTLSFDLSKLKKHSFLKGLKRHYDYHRLYTAKPLITVSEAVAHDLINPLKIKPLWIKTIYNPFDFNAIRTQSNLNSDTLPSTPYIIHVGRYAPQKRHDLLLRVFAKIPAPIQLVLLTKPTQELHDQIAHHQLQSRVLLPGFQANPYPWIKRAKLLVLCSDQEGLPGVLVEALSLSTPVVSTDCPSGPREILTEALSVCLVPLQNEMALFNVIEQQLQHPVQATQAQLNRFDAVTIAKQYVSLALEM